MSVRVEGLAVQTEGFAGDGIAFPFCVIRDFPQKSPIITRSFQQLETKVHFHHAQVEDAQLSLQLFHVFRDGACNCDPKTSVNTLTQRQNSSASQMSVSVWTYVLVLLYRSWHQLSPANRSFAANSTLACDCWDRCQTCCIVRPIVSDGRHVWLNFSAKRQKQSRPRAFSRHVQTALSCFRKDKSCASCLATMNRFTMLQICHSQQKEDECVFVSVGGFYLQWWLDIF